MQFGHRNWIRHGRKSVSIDKYSEQPTLINNYQTIRQQKGFVGNNQTKKTRHDNFHNKNIYEITEKNHNKEAT